MPLYRGFFNKKGPAIPEPVEPTRRIVRSEPAEKVRPTTVPTPAVSIAPAATAAPEAGRTTTPPGAESLNVLSGLVVGWLAIIAGPGRGEVLRLGYGVNDMGSGPGARLRLNFGDVSIAPANHAAIIYTARSRRFYLARSAVAETWLNGQPVRESVELVGGETVRLGQTQLRFVPLCGPDFDWREGS